MQLIVRLIMLLFITMPIYDEELYDLKFIKKLNLDVTS